MQLGEDRRWPGLRADMFAQRLVPPARLNAPADALERSILPDVTEPERQPAHDPGNSRRSFRMQRANRSQFIEGYSLTALLLLHSRSSWGSDLKAPLSESVESCGGVQSAAESSKHRSGVLDRRPSGVSAARVPQGAVTVPRRRRNRLAQPSAYVSGWSEINSRMGAQDTDRSFRFAARSNRFLRVVRSLQDGGFFERESNNRASSARKHRS
jgi:hypothetical protein